MSPVAPLARTARAAETPTTPATGDAPPAPQSPPPLATFRYQPKAGATPGAPTGPVEVAAFAWQLMPGREGVHGVEDFVPAGQDFAIATKIARARAGVAISNQAQAILKNPSNGDLFVTGLSHPMQQAKPDGGTEPLAVPPFIDGDDFAKVMQSVTVTRSDSVVQAIVGTKHIIDLREQPTGTPTELPGPRTA